MNIREILGNVKEYLQNEVRIDGELKDMLEWFCEENGHDIKKKESRFIYIDHLANNFYHNIRMSEHEYGDFTLAQDYQNAYDDIASEVEEDSLYYADEIDEREMNEAIAHRIADELNNPFANEWDYEWVPICQALDAIGLKEFSDISKISDATNGQKLVIAYYILGNDGPLPWAAAEYCID